MSPASANRLQFYGKCRVETNNLATVIIGDVNKAPPVSGVMNFSCHIDDERNIPKPGRRIVYCWHIHDSSSYVSTFAYRWAAMGSNNPTNKNRIGFNIYVGDVRVGSPRVDYNIMGVARKRSDQDYYVSDPYILRFEGNEGKTDLPAGKYLYTNPWTHVTMYDIADNDPITPQTACGNVRNDIIGHAQTMGHTDLIATVKTYCDVHVNRDMLFGKQLSLDKPVRADATVNVDCSAGTDYRVKIDNGNNYFENMRHMKAQHGTEEMISYTISPEEWTGIGLGTPQGEDWKIDGTVPA